MALILSGTNGITDVNGTAAAPAITGTDTDTGVFFGTNTVSLSTGGTERLQVDSSGNLGLGVTPSAWGSGYKALDIQYLGISNTGAGTVDCSFTQNGYYNGTNWIAKYTSPSKRYSISDSGFIWYNGASATAGSAITFTQAMTLDASGNLLIGATSGSYPLLVKKAASSSDNSTVSIVSGTAGYAQVLLGDTASDAVGYLAYNNSTNALEIATNGAERARIDSSGNLLVGTTSAIDSQFHAYRTTSSGQVLRVTNASGATGVAYISFRYGSGGTETGYISTNGTTTTYSTSSDYRLKENVQPMQNALATVAQLKPCTYTWKADGSAGQGFIAHELQEIVPDCVTGAKDAVDADGNPKYQGIDTSFLVATLTAAIQEQQAIITQLQADVAALKAQ